MNKQKFLAQLRKALSALPKSEIEERMAFYREMIDDRMEEGLSEEEAVLSVGSADEIIAQIIADMPLAKIAKERLKPKRRLRVIEIILLVLGSPIWLSLVIAAVAVVLSLYISLWAVTISLWAVFASLAACFVGGVVSCVVFAAVSNGVSALAVLAAAFVCAGFAIFMFYGCKAATKGTLLLAKNMAIRAKNCFIKKEAVQ